MLLIKYSKMATMCFAQFLFRTTHGKWDYPKHHIHVHMYMYIKTPEIRTPRTLCCPKQRGFPLSFCACDNFSPPSLTPQSSQTRRGRCSETVRLLLLPHHPVPAWVHLASYPTAICNMLLKAPQHTLPTSVVAQAMVSHPLMYMYVVCDKCSDTL